MIAPDKSADSGRSDTGDPLVPHFKFARVALGETSPAMTEVFAIRYDVYCLECKFLDANDYPDGIESDEYDNRSVHFTAHNLVGELVGSLRLVHSAASESFPFELHCQAPFEGVVLPPREQCGEVSRLVVRRTYRRRVGDSMAGVPEAFLSDDSPGLPIRRLPGERRSNSPELLLGLYREMYQYSLECGIRYWYAAMERSLARALSRLQFVFVPIGNEVDYYGPVTPYLADLRELESRLNESAPDLLSWFRGR